MKKYLVYLLLLVSGFLSSCLGTYQITTGEPVYKYYTYYYPQPPIRLYQPRTIIVERPRVVVQPRKPELRHPEPKPRTFISTGRGRR